MFTKLGLQMYSVRDLTKDAAALDSTLAKLAALGYSEAQTAGFPILPGEEYAAIYKKNGFTIIGSHYNYDKIRFEKEETVALHRALGTTNIGIGNLPPPGRSTLAGLSAFIEEFNRTAEEYAKEGFKLTYHNHAFEFVRIDGNRTVMDVLADELDPKTTSFVLDTCWVAAGGGDVRRWLERLAGRIDILHLKDMALVGEEGNLTPVNAELGTGNLYWEGIIKTAEETGVKHYNVEMDDGFIDGDPLKSMEICAAYLKPFMK